MSGDFDDKVLKEARELGLSGSIKEVTQSYDTLCSHFSKEGSKIPDEVKGALLEVAPLIGTKDVEYYLKVYHTLSQEDMSIDTSQTYGKVAMIKAASYVYLLNNIESLTKFFKGN